MADSGEHSTGGDPLFLRATERYGGREAVGSTLWLEHFESITFIDDSGMEQVLTAKDLADDEKRESESGYPHVHIGLAQKEDALLVPTESWLRNTFLPALPVHIKGDTAQPHLKFAADLKVFSVPKDLTRGAGVTVVESKAPNRDVAVTLSMRLVPLLGRVASFAAYPYTTDENYGLTAIEADDNVVKMAIGRNKYFELYREPQTEPLPPLTAPHQF